jgi:hypothetical protein
METTFQDATSALGSTHLGEYWARSLLEPVTFLEDLVKRGRNEDVSTKVQNAKLGFHALVGGGVERLKVIRT